mgnify:CR=1 FL=1
MSILTGRAVLSLYKQLLKAAVNDPTKKRASIIKEIQLGFREARDETDPKKLAALFDESNRALKELRRYAHVMKNDSNEWKLDLHH